MTETSAHSFFFSLLFIKKTEKFGAHAQKACLVNLSCNFLYLARSSTPTADRHHFLEPNFVIHDVLMLMWLTSCVVVESCSPFFCIRLVQYSWLRSRSVDAEEIITAYVLPKGSLSNGYHCTNSTFSLMPSKMPIADCREICTMYMYLHIFARAECREKSSLGKIPRNPATSSREKSEKWCFSDLFRSMIQVQIM